MFDETLITFEGESLNEKLNRSDLNSTMSDSETLCGLVSALALNAGLYVKGNAHNKNDPMYKLAERVRVALEVISKQINQEANGKKKT